MPAAALVMSIPSPPPKNAPRRVVRSFLCQDDLWKAFQDRAEALECSVDWLMSEAMKRLLESGPQPDPAPPSVNVQPVRPVVRAIPPTLPVPALPPPPNRASLAPVPPPPPRTRKASASFVGPRPSTIALVATSTDRAHAGESSRSVVDADRFTIGRSPRTTNLVLRDPAVSRQHAILERTADGFVIVDMASRNGVLVNGARITRALLRPGDVVAIGPFSIVVERA